MSGLAGLRAARLEQLEGLRRARDLDAMLIHAQGGALGAATRSNAYLRMFVDWDGLESPSSLLLTAHCRTLILSNPFQLRAARRVEGVDTVVCAAPALLGETVRGLLARHDARIGEAGASELAMQAAVSMQQRYRARASKTSHPNSIAGDGPRRPPKSKRSRAPPRSAMRCSRAFPHYCAQIAKLGARSANSGTSR